MGEKMNKVLALLVLAVLTLTGCSPSLKDTDPDGYEACSRLDRARDKSLDTEETMGLFIWGVGEKAVLAKTESIRNDVTDIPEISKLSKAKAYSVKDSLAQACRDLGVQVREVTKSP